MKEKPYLILAGGSGYLGSLLISYFKKTYHIVVLTRNKSQVGSGIQFTNWKDNWKQYINHDTIIINLAGKSINCLFTKKNKELLISSRMQAIKNIFEAIKNHPTPPKLWINASGISIYKETYNTDFDEFNFDYGTDFLSHLSQQWEKEFYNTSTPNTRKVAIRLAPVLGEDSKAIQSLIPVVKMRLGGKQGTGKQLFPFIHQTDFVRAINWIITHQKITKSVNLIAPTPTTNDEFMKEFRKESNVKLGLPTPAFLLHLSKYITQIEPEIILTSLYAKPGKMVNSRFQFLYPTISSALSEILQNK